MIYDPECYELADHFLAPAPEADVSALAQAIQDAVDDWLARGERPSAARRAAAA